VAIKATSEMRKKVKKPTWIRNMILLLHSCRMRKQRLRWQRMERGGREGVCVKEGGRGKQSPTMEDDLEWAASSGELRWIETTPTGMLGDHTEAVARLSY